MNIVDIKSCLTASFLLLAGFAWPGSAAATPTAEELETGVLNSRAKIVSGELELTTQYLAIPKGSPENHWNNRRYRIVFEGDRIKASRQSLRTKIRNHTIITGDRFIFVPDQGYGVAIVNHSDDITPSAGDGVFDPRLLGITPGQPHALSVL